MNFLKKKEEKKPEEEKPPYMLMADELRGKDGIDCREAIVAGNRMDFARGKDIYRYFRDNKEKLNAVQPESMRNWTLDTRIKAFGDELLKKGVIRAAERAYSKPKPGKTKLVKFPKKLVITQRPSGDNFELVDDSNAFYVWMYEMPTNKYLTGVLSALIVVVAIGGCLFPLAPNGIKLCVLYTCVFLLIFIFTMTVIRLVVFGFLWFFQGRFVWLWPNLFSDEVGFTDAFRPFVEEEKDADGKLFPPPGYLARVVVAAGLGFSVFLLARNGPDGASVRDATMRAHKDVLEYLNLYDDAHQGLRLGDGNETNLTDVNGTLNGTGDFGEKAGAGEGAGGAGGGADAGGAAEEKEEKFVFPDVEQLEAELKEELAGEEAPKDDL